jgi:tRNA modification GTPase
MTKMDLVESVPAWSREIPLILISSQTGLGMDRLWEALIAVAERHDAGEIGGVIGTAARCRDSLAQATRCLEVAIESTRDQVGHELVAAEMRSAVEHLGEVTGAVYTEDILDRVFSRFCIGK